MYNGFYNPYMSYSSFAKPSIFGNLFKKFSLSGFLSGANKTLNVVNQAIPIYYQIKPMVNNAKTMLRVMSAVKSSDNKPSNNYNSDTKNNKNNNYVSDGSPVFFI